MRNGIGLLLFGIVSICAAAQAQQPVPQQSFMHHFEVFAEGGASMSNQHTDARLVLGSVQPVTLDVIIDRVSLRTTGRLFAGARFWIDSHQAIEASYSYAPTDLVFSLACFVNCRSFNGVASAVRTSFFAGNYVHTLPGVAHLKPFLTSGIGILYFSSSNFNAPIANRRNLTVNFGGGFNFNVSRHWSVRAEYRDWIFEMPNNPGSFAIPGIAHNSVPSLGLSYRF